MSTKELTKQEEIRENLAEVLSFPHIEGDDLEWDGLSEHTKTGYRKEAGIILSYLHSQGLVIKKELPEREWYDDWGGESGKAGYELAIKDMFDSIEPLIKDT